MSQPVSLPVSLLNLAELAESGTDTTSGEARGMGALATARGPLPLKAMTVAARIDGLAARTEVEQTFVNNLGETLEATYIFPLPDRAAVTGFQLLAAGRTIDGLLRERGEARREYDEAIAKGHRAAIAEEERPDVFTLRVGNLPAGEEARVKLTLVGPLAVDVGEATYRFPLVVAPRYIPGVPLDGDAVGDGTAPDTDAVPDASRITPPVLLPGYPNPVRLEIGVELNPAAIAARDLRSSLPAASEDVEGGLQRIRVIPGQRLDQDFILRFKVGAGAVTTSLVVERDPGASAEGTFLLTVVPPAAPPGSRPPRDIAFVLDRSGSMQGWKIVAARRAMGRMVETLGDADRFSILAFDNDIESPEELEAGLVPATGRNRSIAAGFLAGIDACGGTEMAEPLRQAVRMLAGAGSGRDRAIVLVTDGEVGNEDQILRELASGLKDLRVFALGVDCAVNAGFLNRLARAGGGACELVESEARLEEVMDRVHRLIATPVLTDLRLDPAGLEVQADTVTPSRLPALFAGVPVTILGRWSGRGDGSLALKAKEPEGKAWRETPRSVEGRSGALAPLWARGRIRDLEDAYASHRGDLPAIEKEIVAASLRFGVLSRFTAYVAVDRAAVVEKGGELHRVVQPVEMPAGWEMHAESRALRERAPRLMYRRSLGLSRLWRMAPSSGLSLDDIPERLVRSAPHVPIEHSPAEVIERALEELRVVGKRGARARRSCLKRVAAPMLAWLTNNLDPSTSPKAIERSERLCREIEAALRKKWRLRPAEFERLFAAIEAALREILAILRRESPAARSREFWK